jgi:DNA-directed RNA polymerase III subunit RPC6
LAQQVADTNLASVRLAPANIEELLEVLLMDGEIERIRIRRPEGDYDTPEMIANARKRKKMAGKSPKSNGRKKKRARLDDDEGSDDIDRDSMDDFVEDDLAESEEDDFHDSTNGVNGASTSSKVGRPGPPDRNKYYYVFRPVRKPEHLAYNLGIGFTDSPCGVCPVASACDNREKPAFEDRSLNASIGSVVPHTPHASRMSLEARMAARLKLKAPGTSIVDDAGPWRGGGTRGKQRVGLVNPKDCVYFTKWLEFS